MISLKPSQLFHLSPQCLSRPSRRDGIARRHYFQESSAKAFRSVIQAKRLDTELRALCLRAIEAVAQAFKAFDYPGLGECFDE